MRATAGRFWALATVVVLVLIAVAIFFLADNIDSKPAAAIPKKHDSGQASLTTESLVKQSKPVGKLEPEIKISPSSEGLNGAIHGNVIFLDEEFPPGLAVSAKQLSTDTTSSDNSGPIQTAKVSEDGRFEFRELDLGTYLVSANSDIGSTGKRITLTEHAPVRQLSLVLQAGLRSEGIVVDETGAPIGAAQLVALTFEGETVRGIARESLSSVSGEDGVFKFAGLRAGNWEVYVAADGFAAQVFGPIVAGKRDHVITLDRGVTLTGRVIQAYDEAPLADVSVVATAVSWEIESARTISGQDGTFVITGLSPAMYLIDVATRPCVLSDGPYELALMPGQTELEPIELRVEAGGIVRGRVVDGRSGVGIPNVTVSPSYESRQISNNTSVVSGQDGSFELNGMQPGILSIGVWNFPTGYIEEIKGHQRNTFTLQLGEELEGIEVVMHPGVTIEGIVVSGAGAGVPGVGVLAEVPERMHNISYTDGAGQFVLRGDYAGREVRLIAEESMAVAEPFGPVIVPEDGLQGVRIVLDVDTSAIASGSVVNANGNPVQGTVSFYGETSRARRSTLADAKGGFALSGLRAGKYRISFRENGGRNIPVGELTLAVGEVRRGVRLVYEPSGHLEMSGRVSSPSGLPIRANINVFAWDDTGKTQITQTFANYNGDFRVRSLEPGEYDLEFSFPGFAPGTLSAVTAGTSHIELLMHSLTP